MAISAFLGHPLVAAAAKLVDNRMKLQLASHQLQRLHEPPQLVLSATQLTFCAAAYAFPTFMCLQLVTATYTSQLFAWSLCMPFP